MSRFVSGAVSQLPTPAPPPAPEPDALTVLGSYGRHPSIAAQPTTGQAPRDAVLHGGRLFIGYGDWTGNTGPIDIAHLNIATGLHGTSLEDSPTEAIDRFRVIGGSLFAPWTDSHPSMPYLGYSTDHGGAWRNVDNGKEGALHVFDVASLSGDPSTDIFMCGSDIIDNAGHGIVYGSGDGGETWSLAFDQGSPGGFSRIHSLSAYAGSLWAVGLGVTEYDGTSWTPWTGPWEVGGKAHVSQGALVSASGWFNGTTSEQHAVDGELATSMTAVTVDGLGRLWGTYSNNLYVGTVGVDSLTWDRVAHLPWESFMASQIAVDHVAGVLWVVAADCSVRSATLPAIP